MVKRMLMMVVGNFFIGVAVSLFRLSSFGTDPYTTMNLGISGFINMQFGIYQLIINIFLLGFVWLFGRSHIGSGTVVNMVCIGFIADFFVYLYGNMIDGTLTYSMRISIMLIAVLIAGIAVALYITADLGVAPYDAMALIIAKVTNDKVPFAWARIMTDVTCVVIGFSFGATVGIGTVITAFFTGPIVQFFKVHVAEPMLRSRSITDQKAAINVSKG